MSSVFFFLLVTFFVVVRNLLLLEKQPMKSKPQNLKPREQEQCWVILWFCSTPSQVCWGFLNNQLYPVKRDCVVNHSHGPPHFSDWLFLWVKLRRRWKAVSKHIQQKTFSFLSFRKKNLLMYLVIGVYVSYRSYILHLRGVLWMI